MAKYSIIEISKIIEHPALLMSIEHDEELCKTVVNGNENAILYVKHITFELIVSNTKTLYHLSQRIYNIRKLSSDICIRLIHLITNKYKKEYACNERIFSHLKRITQNPDAECLQLFKEINDKHDEYKKNS